MIIEDTRILYAGQDCMVINKLPGESAEPTDAGGMIDLPRILAAQFGEAGGGQTGGPSFPAAVHRLDVPVSGCVLFARNPAAMASLSAAFSQGRAEKIYWAIIEMPPPGVVPAETPAETVELIHWIKTDVRRNKSIAYNEEGPGRKKAVLRYRVLGRGTRYLFLEIELITGRHHQIRAQLAALGLRIKGDLKYGSRRSEKNGGIRLHGFSLSFPSPADPEKIIRVSGEPPLQDPLWDAFKKARGLPPL
ncbi:MAG: RNA pseudouridine synthase [Treponema sp.]|jgi:23S rRNA pseudouridine1911/1915/1917 synthase|nr:RNA pseudouridine synthase [Treponema sp.]